MSRFKLKLAALLAATAFALPAVAQDVAIRGEQAQASALCVSGG